MKKLLCFVIPIIIGICFAFGLNKFLDYKIDDLLNSKNLVPLMNEYSNDLKDKGEIVNNYLLSKKDIMILGSSELSNSVKRQHATSYFNSNRTKDMLFTVGRPYSQGLQQALAIGSVDPNIKDKKVVMLVSLQAFLSRRGMPAKAFQSRFSPSQFYEFLNNPDISTKNKTVMAKRVNSLLKGNSEYNAERMYAELYYEDGILASIERTLLKPYFILREKTISLKQKGLLYLYLKDLPDKKEENKIAKPIDWKEEEKQAVIEAKERTKGNKYKIDNEYYNKILKKQLGSMKGKFSHVNLIKSKEMDDYKEFLNVCENLGVKPIIVIMPNADWYYNYTGLTRDKRVKFYDTVQKLAEEKGFEVINLKDKENEDYYLKDIMHLGTKGWLDISERLYKRYNEGQIYNN